MSGDDLIPSDKIKVNVTPEDFEHIKVIGRGYFGKVTQVRYKKDNMIYALKSLKKCKLKEEKHIEHTKTERKILELVQHPFIVSLKFAFQTDKKLYFVMDCYNGGELFYHLRTKGRFSENHARFYLSQIVLALEFLHSKKIIYRDLKPENIVLDKSGYVKLTDFGLAKENIGDEVTTQTFCGTPEYLAPEIIRGDKYGKAVDMWCLGILLFEMLYGFVSINV
jgi:serine/threonine protein kinase